LTDTLIPSQGSGANFACLTSLTGYAADAALQLDALLWDSGGAASGNITYVGASYG